MPSRAGVGLEAIPEILEVKRAHDAIGAKGANFLTWSCLHHLSKDTARSSNPRLT